MAARIFRLCAVLCTASVLASTALAHPMGNFSVNHYSKLDVQSDKIVIRYFIDLVEIPTYQELQQANIAASADIPIDPHASNVIRYVEMRGAELGSGLRLVVNGRSIAVRMRSSDVIFPPGAGGLPTMKMGFVYEAEYPSDTDRQHVNVLYTDQNYPGHSGWKEMTAVASAGTLISSSVPSTDRSRELSDYSTDLLNSPPAILEASIKAALPPAAVAILKPESQTVRESTYHQAWGSMAVKKSNAIPPPHQATVAPFSTAPLHTSASPVQLRANQQQTPRSKFTELITAQHLSIWFLLTAAIIAIGLGALHALEPGHGKTIVAAYLVGSRGTARHAALLGLIVTVSHTAGVFALGAITLYASRYILPEQLYPWLGVFSGMTIAVLGCYMFLRRSTGTATDHSHVPGVPNLHTFFSRRVASDDAEPAQDMLRNAATSRVSLTQLFTLGITGGIIPCPAALIVLLSAFALHRVALGFFLIVAFSLGLAAVLIGFGMLMVYARRFMTHLQIDGPLTKRWLPLVSSAFIMILGIGLAIQAFATTQFSMHLPSNNGIGSLLLIAGLGLILGMRHSTDADHVVAISTIVSRQGSIRNAAVIGSVWGLGHTITIFIVGSLIILFGVTIPPRVGLSMEFSVAIMLILLGILNLSGVMRKITLYFTPMRPGAQDNRSEPTLVTVSTNTRGRVERAIANLGLYQCLRPLAIGLVHGLAGSAAIALLVLSTIHNPYWATVYLIVFGIGTLIGMMCMTTAIAVPLAYAGTRFSRFSHYFGVASGVVSLCFGSFLVYQLGFLGGLFTSHPQWTPQ